MFQQGISGLNAAARDLEVIGNNIANANTVGAKASRVEFADVYANAALHQDTAASGMGVAVAAVTQSFGQGSVRTTGNPMDIAINGTGFFVVAAPGASGDLALTRNGQFQLDRQGYMVTSAGPRLQGRTIDAATGLPGGVVGDVQLPAQGIAPRVSSAATLSVNLDSRAAPPAAATPTFSTANAASYAATTSVPVYDQQGNEHVLSTFFRRTAAANEWDVYAALDGSAVPAPAGGAQQPVGRLAFNADGALDAARSGSLAGGVLTAGDLALDLPFPAGTLPVAGAASATTAPVRLSFDGSSQFGTAFGVNAVSQDGYAPGQLTGFAVGVDGVVQARYSNGRTMPAAQVVLADVRNEQGLVPVGGNLWRTTPQSGTPAISAPGTSNLGVLQGGAVEESNIDLTQQLVDMIGAQRAYQANAQTIKTQDQLLSTLVNLR